MSYKYKTNGVLLPYEFTLFSNPSPHLFARLIVLLPYEFTLFSNRERLQQLEQAVLLPYEFTLFSNALL